MKEIREVRLVMLADEYPDLSYLEQDCFAPEGAERLAKYGDTWSCVGLRVDAVIVVNGVLQTITSAGLWGIESDSGDGYFEQVWAEELAQLTDQLEELGFTAEEISDAPTEKVEV